MPLRYQIQRMPMLSDIIAETDTFSLLMAGTTYALHAKAIGVAILSEHLAMAYRGLASATTSSRIAEEISESIVFVQGTELNAIIQVCRLNLDAEELRTQFLHYCQNSRIWYNVHHSS